MGDPVLHIELRRWADCLVIAPLSANTLAKCAQGLCDNLLTCVVSTVLLLSLRCFAPGPGPSNQSAFFDGGLWMSCKWPSMQMHGHYGSTHMPDIYSTQMLLRKMRSVGGKPAWGAPDHLRDNGFRLRIPVG